MLNPNIKKALLASNAFKYLDMHELDMLLHYCKIISFSPGEILFYQGKKSDGMYVIIHGQAQVTVKVLGESILSLATINEGNFIGEVSIIEKGPAAATVLANTPLECLLISTSYFETLSLFLPETHHKIIKAITEGVCERLNNLQHQITHFMSHSQMASTSIFSETINSLKKPTLIRFDDLHINQDELNNSHFFRHYTDEEFSILLKYSELLQAPNHCKLIKDSAKNTACYLLLFGAVQITITQHTKTAKVAVIGPMQLFGSCYTIDEKPSIFEFTTCERAVLLKISEAHLIELEKNHHTLWYKLYDELCKTFVGMEKSADKLNIRLHSELYNR